MSTRHTKLSVFCNVCGIPFLTYLSKIKIGRGKHCSRACCFKSSARTGRKRKISRLLLHFCKVCQNEFYVKPWLVKKGWGNFCSRKCANSTYPKGDKAPGWRGGVTSPNMLIRRSERMKQWRIAVFVRDQYTCFFCGVIGGNLHAHHIKSFSKFPELRFELNNGITLCKICHRKVHLCH